MLKPLKHPTVFVLLTCCLAGWLLACMDPRGPRLPFSYRPLQYPLDRVRVLVGEDSRFDDYRLLEEISRFSYASTFKVLATSDGVFSRGFDLLGEPDHGRAYLSGVRVRVHEKPIVYGLVSPVIVRTEFRFATQAIGELPLMSTDQAVAQLRADGLINDDTTVNWRAALHDALLLLAMLAWLYAAAMIPTWRLWRSITPAQRRRLRNACPECGYDRSATPDRPCPECGGG